MPALVKLGCCSCAFLLLLTTFTTFFYQFAMTRCRVMALSPGSGGVWKQCLAQHCTDRLPCRGQRRAGPVLLTGATTRRWGDSRSYTDFLPFILKANPIWFWFSLWGDCLLFLERGDPYFICHTSCREAIAISQCRC